MSRLNGHKAAETFTRRGGRRVELFVPFKHRRRTYAYVDFAPLLLDHVLRWQDGDYANAVALMADLSGLKVDVIRQLRYPDTDRVMAAFLEMLPDHVRGDITAGRVPLTPQALPEPRDDVPAFEPTAGLDELPAATDEREAAQEALPEAEPLSPEAAAGLLGPILPAQPPFGPKPKPAEPEPTPETPPPVESEGDPIDLGGM